MGSAINFQERTTDIVLEMCRFWTSSSAEIRDAVEAGKRHLAKHAKKAVR